MTEKVENKKRVRAPAYRSPSAKAVVSLRTKVGWDQAELAEKLRVSVGSVRAWEAGTSPMPSGTWSLFAIQAVYQLASNEKPTGTDITNLRQSMGWTQEEFADRVGTSARRVSDWERDNHKMHIGLWRAMRVSSAIEDPEHVAV